MDEHLQLPERLVVPVFPLPNAILFPGARLPLFIFEPRYKQMIDDVLDGKQYLSVALLVKKDDESHPAVISGLGQITEVEQLPKNEKNIVVSGLTRVRIGKHVSESPYIRAEVEPITEQMPDQETHELLFNRLREAVKTWLFRMRTGSIRLLAELGNVRTVGEICDFFGAYLIDDFIARQRLLDEIDVVRRAEIILEMVEKELYRYSAPFEN